MYWRWPKIGKIKDYQKHFEHSSNVPGGPTKRNSPIRGVRKMRRKSTRISAPIPRYHQPYAPVYRSMYPPHPPPPKTSNNTWWIMPALTSINRIVDKATISEIQTKLSETSLLCQNHCQKYTRSCWAPNSLLGSNQSLPSARYWKIMTKMSVGPTTWTPKGIISMAIGPSNIRCWICLTQVPSPSLFQLILSLRILCLRIIQQNQLHDHPLSN